jgi:TolB-like protein/class 3 adenylate cyclase/Tfp pilus assembly protein PilF
LNRRLAAILVADVVDYSRLMEADESGTLAALKDRRKTIVQPLVREHAGRIVKYMGDGVLVEFASAVNAIKAALELQSRFTEANQVLADERRMVLRIGINLGDVIGEGSDIYGDGVNVAARLEGLAMPGGICISGKVHEEVRGKLDFAVGDLGEVELKNIARPVRAYWARAGATSSIGDIPTALPLPSKPSIAVLPFQNMSGDPEQEYFADGMVEEIITGLSRMHWLFVIARNSTFTYKHRAVDVRQVGREMGVRYVLEGSVRKAGSRVRITGQLIDATSGAHLWAERFESALEDIFSLQDQLTANVIAAIAPKLQQAEIERARRKPTENLDAYDYYLRGLAATHQWTKEANAEAVQHFYRAIELDPNYAAAYGMAARSYSQRKVGGWVLDGLFETAEAERLARRAVQLGPNDAVALATAGIALSFVVGDLDGGRDLVDRATAIDPNMAWAWLFSGWTRIWLGQPDLALEHFARAIRLNPQDPYRSSMHAGMACGHFFNGRYEEALAWAELCVRGEQRGFANSISMVAASAALSGDLDRAREGLKKLAGLDPTMSISKLQSYFPLRRPEDTARYTEGLRKAGLPE